MALNENPPCDNLRTQTPPHLISNPSTSQKLYWWHDLSGLTGSSIVPPTCCLDSEKCKSASAVKATIATDGCTKRISRIRRRYRCTSRLQSLHKKRMHRGGISRIFFSPFVLSRYAVTTKRRGKHCRRREERELQETGQVGTVPFHWEICHNTAVRYSPTSVLDGLRRDFKFEFSQTVL